VYLAARGRWREAGITAAVGGLVLAISVFVDASLWQQFLATLLMRGPGDSSALLPVPYVARGALALVLALTAGRLAPRVGEPILVIAIVLALPTLWVDALSTLVALVPIIRAGGSRSRVSARQQSSRSLRAGPLSEIAAG
jgi:hypothetical protein